MKIKGIIFSIFLSFLVLLNIVPFNSYAANGQSSFNNGNSYSVSEPNYGFVNTDYPYVADETGINFTLSLGLDTSRNSAHIYLVPVDTLTDFQLYRARTYYSLIQELDLLHLNSVYGNGSHNISTKSLGLSIGTYKLVAVVGADLVDTADIYEYYFLYSGKSLGSLGEGIERNDYKASVREYINGQQVDIPVSNHAYRNLFSYTGTLTPLPDGSKSAQIRLSLSNFNVNSDLNADYYAMWLQSLSFDLTNNDGYYTADYCSIYLYNHRTKINHFLGVFNNISRRNQTSSLYPYIISFPASYVDLGDDLTVQLYFQSYQADKGHIGDQFDYTVTCNSIAFLAYSSMSLNTNLSIDNLANAGNSLGSVPKPDLDFDELNLNNVIGNESISSASRFFFSLYKYEIIVLMMMVVAILVLLSYLFFGKK